MSTAAEPAVGNAERPLSPGNFVGALVADKVEFAVAVDLMLEIRGAELAVAGHAEPAAVGIGAPEGTPVVDFVPGTAVAVPGFGCAESVMTNLAGSSVIENLAGACMGGSAGESLLDTAGYGKVVAELAAAAIAEPVVAASNGIGRLDQVEGSPGKREDRRQH